MSGRAGREDEAAFDADAAWGRYAPPIFTRGWLGFCHRLSALPGGRRLALWARHPLKHRLTGPVDAKLWGYRLRLMPRGNLSESRWLFLPHALDRAERRFWQRHLQSGDVFIDIGANAGVYTCWGARCVGPTGRVVSVEPDPAMQQRIHFNVQQNQLTNVQIIDCALGATPGEAQLVVGQGNRGENALAESDGDGSGESDQTSESITVPVRTLADVCDAERVDRIAGLKLDIEGREHAVLGQFLESSNAGRYPRFIQFEKGLSSQNATLHALVCSYGYQRVCEGRMNAIYGRVGSSGVL
jgi:FkbM family methyltransferase